MISTLLKFTGEHGPWMLARSAGLIAYTALFLSVASGLLTSTKLFQRVFPGRDTLLFHRGTTAIAFLFTAIHLGSLAFDHYVGFSLGELLLPFASHYRTLGLTLGVGALYLGLITWVSSFAQRYLTARAWRSLHYLAFPAWLVALLHAVVVGTDAGHPVVKALFTFTAAVVALLVIYRLGEAWVHAAEPDNHSQSRNRGFGGRRATS